MKATYSHKKAFSVIQIRMPPIPILFRLLAILPLHFKSLRGPCVQVKFRSYPSDQVQDLRILESCFYLTKRFFRVSGTTCSTCHDYILDILVERAFDISFQITCIALIKDL